MTVAGNFVLGYARVSRSRNPEHFTQDAGALWREALDSSLRFAPFGMTVDASFLELYPSNAKVSFRDNVAACPVLDMEMGANRPASG